ncbi:hypothetical protein [Halolamina sp.]|uniref:hypothetical protein n=1 Tax=Halolamina sp. TaxID=1940283 RepID=UPI003564BDF0
MSPRIPCASPECDRPVLPEESHVLVQGNLVLTDDRDRKDTYYAHLECWRELTDEWGSL